MLVKKASRQLEQQIALVKGPDCLVLVEQIVFVKCNHAGRRVLEELFVSVH